MICVIRRAKHGPNTGQQGTRLSIELSQFFKRRAGEGSCSPAHDAHNFALEGAY